MRDAWNDWFEFPLAPGIERPYGIVGEYPPKITIKKMYRVVPSKVELVNLECGCWYQQRGLYLVRFRACEAHTLASK